MARRAFSVKAFAIAVLRRASYRAPARSEALRQARSARNTYHCKKCSASFSRREVQIDHKLPVVSTSGWDSFDGFIDRLFCGVDGLQVLCKPCHKEKTQAENKARREAKKQAGEDMSAPYQFKRSAQQGKLGETLFFEANCKTLEKLDGRQGDFKEKATGAVVEVKTDYFEMAKTPNFFFEYISNEEKQTPGGPWQARTHGVSKFVYFYINDLTYFTFDLNKLLGRLEKLLPSLRPSRVENVAHTTIGYRVPREAVADLATEHRIRMSSKEKK